MRKVFLLGIIFLLLSATANAQVRGGLKVGGNLNFPNWEPDVPIGNLGSALSFNFGGLVDFSISRNFGIEVNALYNGQKTKWNYREFDPYYYGGLADYEGTLTLSVLSFPVLAKVKFPLGQVSPFLGIGPEIGFILSHKGKLEVTADGDVVYEETEDLMYLTKSVNFALVLAGGVDIDLGRVILSPELRFSLGLTDWEEGELASRKNSQLLFLVGVKF